MGRECSVVRRPALLSALRSFVQCRNKADDMTTCCCGVTVVFVSV